MQHIQAHKKFKDISNKVDEIYSIYMMLKSDIDEMTDTQIRSQVRKILNRLPNVSDYAIDQALDSLKSFLIYGRLKVQSDEMKRKISEVKSFVYSLDKDTPEVSDKKIQEIKDRYNYIKKNEDTQDLDSLIKYAKITENALLRLNFEQLSEEDAKELGNIKSDLASLIKNFEGVQKSRKYGPYLYEPIYRLASETYAKRNPEKAESITATILDFIERPDKIEMFEPYIKRLINKRMKGPEFVRFYKSVMSMRGGEKKYESTEFVPYTEYLALNETYDSYTELKRYVENIGGEIIGNRMYELKHFIKEGDTYNFINDFLQSGTTAIIFMKKLEFPGTFVPPEAYDGFGPNAPLLKLQYTNGIIMIRADSANIPTVLHELEHAYDYFRSDGKIDNTKLGQKYLKHAKAAASIGKNIGSDENLLRLYYRTPHEQSSYFVQAINAIEFFDKNGNIKNIHEAYRLFKVFYEGYQYLTPKDKRNLARKFAQYYHRIKEQGPDK